MQVNRQQTEPVRVPRSKRNHMVQVITSMKPGVCNPVAAIPLLPEDSAVGQVRFALEMHETVEVLLNKVHCVISAYFIPKLAQERFEGSMDQYIRSFFGETKTRDVGAEVVPFFETMAFGTYGSNEVYKAMGLHAKPTDLVTTDYLEDYNIVWNYRAKNRSKELEPRDRLDDTLAPAFWPRSRFEHIVPDYDQAKIDGQISLNFVSGQLPVQGIGFRAKYTGTNNDNLATLYETGGNDVVYPRVVATSNDSGSMTGQEGLVGFKTTAAGYPDVFVEMEAGGISLSLSNLELAKKTQAFAKLRERFNGFDDEYIIDALMSGLHIPDQNLKQPILVGQVNTVFGQAKRYASADDLTESVVSGVAAATMRIRVPRTTTGGVILFIAEAVPEQLWERQQDPYFALAEGDGYTQLPDYMRDELDPEKVQLVKNKFIDVSHSQPDDPFGWMPNNAQWNMFGARAGGKYLRPEANTTFDEERQRFWSVEAIDPVLSDDFYIVSEIHQKPFVDLVSDPFDVVAVGNFVIEGNTRFGPALDEATDDYNKVLSKVDQTRNDKEA